jgi:hypothetical protein
MPRKPKAGPSLFGAAQAPPTPTNFAAAPPPRKALLIDAHHDTVVATQPELLPAPTPDHTARHEGELARMLELGIQGDRDMAHLRRIAVWRTRQGEGDLTPRWGDWGEWQVGEVVVLYRPEAHFAGADSLELFGPMFPYGRGVIGLRSPRDGTALAEVILARLAQAMPKKKEKSDA